MREKGPREEDSKIEDPISPMQMTPSASDDEKEKLLISKCVVFSVLCSMALIAKDWCVLSSHPRFEAACCSMCLSRRRSAFESMAKGGQGDNDFVVSPSL